jgi:hypothetical protein
MMDSSLPNTNDDNEAAEDNLSSTRKPLGVAGSLTLSDAVHPLHKTLIRTVDESQSSIARRLTRYNRADHRNPESWG